jgi:preprotein translocase subunit SecF
MAVDFEGGLLYEAEFAQECTTTDINAALEAAGLTNSKIQKYADTKDALIRARLVDDNIEGTKEAIDQALTAAFGAEGFNRRGASAVTSEVGQEFYTIAWVVILCASAAILIYLALRFERTFGVAAVIALVHDLFLTLGIVTLCGVEISLDVVSAFLILLGYSANDTIVIFDRIRENARDSRGKDLKDICNASMNQSLTRTLITSLTTAFVMLCMYSFGGHSLQPFALTLIVGMFFGTYSSSFIAAPTVYEWTTRKREGVLALAKAAPTASGGTKRGRRAARPSSKRSDATT